MVISALHAHICGKFLEVVIHYSSQKLHFVDCMHLVVIVLGIITRWTRLDLEAVGYSLKGVTHIRR